MKQNEELNSAEYKKGSLLFITVENSEALHALTSTVVHFQLTMNI